MGNKTFLGSAENNQPEQVELPAAAAGILPGNVLLRAADKFKKHDGANLGGLVYIAKESPNGDIDRAYLADETVFVCRPKSGDFYQALVATGQVLVVDTPLTSTGTGLLDIATGTDVIVCYSDETITTVATTPVAVKFK